MVPWRGKGQGEWVDEDCFCMITWPKRPPQPLGDQGHHTLYHSWFFNVFGSPTRPDTSDLRLRRKRRLRELALLAWARFRNWCEAKMARQRRRLRHIWTWRQLVQPALLMEEVENELPDAILVNVRKCLTEEAQEVELDLGSGVSSSSGISPSELDRAIGFGEDVPGGYPFPL